MTVQRSDAARNRKRVLAAAKIEHARNGSALGMQEVARRAGVGIGTVYRHFPSRQALIVAIAHPFHERCLTLARAIERARPEQDRFDAYVRGLARVVADHGVEGHSMWDGPAAAPVRAELRMLIGEFVDAARNHGTLRHDMTTEDAFAMLWTIAMLVEAASEAIWQRHVELVLDTVTGAPPRELTTPAIDRAQWDQFVLPRRGEAVAVDDYSNVGG